MKCQRCKEREANVQIVQQISGKKPQTFYLCDVCARELGISIPNFSKTSKYTTNPFTAMSSIFNTDFGLGDQLIGLSEPDTCDQCNLTFDEFKKTGFLGCANCYEAFSAKMDPVFLRTQMGKEHVGRKLRRPEEKSSSGKSPGAADRKKTLSSKQTDESDKEFADTGVSGQDIDDNLDPDSEELAVLERKHIESLIDEKTQQMKAAVSAEDYLQAARLRDEIVRLTKQKDGEQI
jgi:protein arginine kinase activator